MYARSKPTQVVAAVVIVLSSALYPSTTNGFSLWHHLHRRQLAVLSGRPHPYQDRTQNDGFSFVLSAEKTKQSRSSAVANVSDEDDEKPAGIVGAQFFGGNKQKEEFYDPQAEIEAGLEVGVVNKNVYYRFADQNAFPDRITASIAESCQNQINAVLFGDEHVGSSMKYTYASSVQWETVFPVQKKTSTPLQELEASLNFYRRLNIAIVSGESIKSESAATVVRLRWEISVQWPTFWEPRILVTGTSELTLDDSIDQIIKQKDTLDTDLFRTIQQQYFPRFWDFYHIGMTPAAEVSPTLPVNKRNIFSTYRLTELPPRLVLQPSLLDTSRDDSNACVLPNHAFSCVIKTMGPEKQFYTPVTGVQVRLVPTKDNELLLQYDIPISTEYLSNPILVLPGSDPELPIEQEPDCKYVFTPRRFVATVTYGGNPQDAEITTLRKKLYDQVTKDGYKPVVDTSGRPKFFFTINSIKACYTDEGLGMAVYEWRPQFANPNEIGIEIEI